MNCGKNKEKKTKVNEILGWAHTVQHRRLS
jgi:hypothetical protein